MKYLVPLELPYSYLKKWNSEIFNDFVTFSDSNQPIIVKDEKDIKNYILFRVGGFTNLNNKKYAVLLKYKEDYYSDKITKDPERKPHLSSKNVVVDSEGNIVLEPSDYNSIYLFGGIAYVEYSGYYNLISNKKYEDYDNHVSSVEHIILYGYGKPAIAINKFTGKEIFIE